MNTRVINPADLVAQLAELRAELDRLGLQLEAARKRVAEAALTMVNVSLTKSDLVNVDDRRRDHAKLTR